MNLINFKQCFNCVEHKKYISHCNANKNTCKKEYKAKKMTFRMFQHNFNYKKNNQILSPHKNKGGGGLKYLSC